MKSFLTLYFVFTDLQFHYYYHYTINSQRGTLLEPKNGAEQTIDLLIENSGRHNVGGENEFKQQKGLPADYGGYISLNGVDQTRIETFALEFKSDWVKK